MLRLRGYEAADVDGPDCSLLNWSKVRIWLAVVGIYSVTGEAMFSLRFNHNSHVRENFEPHERTTHSR
jgi:hypothetical protein